MIYRFTYIKRDQSIIKPISFLLLLVLHIMSSEEINYTLPDTDEVVDFIEKGGYGKVCLVKHEGRILARKEVEYSSENASKVDDTIHEIEVLKGLKHTNIVEINDYYIDTEKNIIYIYTEYCEKGDLLGIVDEKRGKKENFSFVVFFQSNYFVFRK